MKKLIDIPNSAPSVISFKEKANQYWTQERIAKLTGGKRLNLLPTNGAELLRVMGLMNGDASISADAVSKFLQINHMIEIMRKPFELLKNQFTTVRIVDCGSGNSYLTLLIAWLFKEVWRHPAQILGIDSNERVIKNSQDRAKKLGWEDFLNFRKQTVAELLAELQGDQSPSDDLRKNRFHGVVALHACDTATDDAISLGIRTGADFIGVAPCCQAEVAKQFSEFSSKNAKHPFNVMIRSPHLRRDTGALVTDSMRVLLMRGSGYEVTATEFVPSNHTPKNRILLGERRGSWSQEALQEYLELSRSLGNVRITLGKNLSPRAQEILDRLMSAP